MLEINNLSCGDLKSVYLTVKAGECVSLSGPSGSGKTTLLRAIADLDIHGGQVLWQGIQQNDMPAHEWRRRIAYLPAESAWWFDTVGEHFQTIDNAPIHMLGLRENLLQSPVSETSSGERQRLALLRVLSRHPQVLLLDEPTANLDEATRASVEALIEKYRVEYQAAVFWVGHDISQLKRVASRHYLIDPQTNTLKETKWKA